MDKSALTPTNPMDFVKFIRDTREPQKRAKFSQDDLDISLLADIDGWKALKSFMLKRKENLLQLKGIDIEGANYEEMGKLFYFAKLVTEEIDAIINKVETTKKVVDGE